MILSVGALHMWNLLYSTKNCNSIVSVTSMFLQIHFLRPID